MRVRSGTALGLGLAMTGLVACSDHPVGQVMENIPPHIEISGGPRDGNRGFYKTPIYWYGWDDDGRVEHYEWTLDPPQVFSDEEISHPESFPDLVLEPRRGFGDNIGVLRVHKDVDGSDHTFDYFLTHATDRIFTLTAATTDSFVNVNNRRVPDVTASEAHRVYVRAVDTEGAYSDAARLGFTAWTYTPTSWITYPDTEREILRTGTRLIVRWDGIDPDAPVLSRPWPTGYFYKLINLRNLSPPLNVLTATDPQRVAYERAETIPWKYVSAETLGVTLEVSPGDYMFALQAQDAAGGIEPFLGWRKGQTPPGNAFLVSVGQNGGIPDLNIAEPVLGSFSYRGSVRFFEEEVPVNTSLRFTWNASAEEYGGRIDAFSWGLDISDLDLEGPNSGWSFWGRTTTTTGPIEFANPGTHVLYVRVRDTNGTITMGALVLRFFDMPLNREYLFIDDSFDRGLPLDRDHDAFWKDLLRDSGRFNEFDLRPENSWFETGGDNDAKFLHPKEPPLSLLGQYKMLIWSTHGAGYCGRTGLLDSATLSSDLRLYLEAGGKLWLTGPMSIGPLTQGFDCPPPAWATEDDPPAPAGQTEYPQRFEPGDFPYDILKLRDMRVENNKGVRWNDTMERAEAWNPADPILPTLEIDVEKFNPARWDIAGLSHSDALFEPLLLNGTPGFRGQIDSLYAYVAAGQIRRPDLPTVWSPFHMRPCAIRWHDPDPDREHGRVMWFGFGLYYMQQDQVQETLNRAIDWFREETPPPPEGDEEALLRLRKAGFRPQNER